MFRPKDENPWDMFYEGKIGAAKAKLNNLVIHNYPEMVSCAAYIEHACFHIELGELEVAEKSLKLLEEKKGARYFEKEDYYPYPKVHTLDPNFYRAILQLELGNIDLAMKFVGKMDAISDKQSRFSILLLKQFILLKSNSKLIAETFSQMSEFSDVFFYSINKYDNQTNSNTAFSRLGAEQLALHVLVANGYVGYNDFIPQCTFNEVIAISLKELVNSYLKYTP